MTAERQPRRATIYTIAQEAGLSPSSVSLALNKPGRLPQETEERVREIAERQGYRRSVTARALVKGRSGILVFIADNLSHPFSGKIAEQAERIARELGFFLVMVGSGPGYDVRSLVKEVDYFADGLMLGVTQLSDQEITELSEQIPLVALNRESDRYSCVTVDDTAAVDEMFSRIREAGHQRAGYVGSATNVYTDTRRYALYRAAAERHGLEFVDCGRYTQEESASDVVARAVIASGVTACTVFSDVRALQLIGWLTRLGVRVPADVSVAGHDDTFGSTFLTPTLATISEPLDMLTEVGMRMLVAKIDPDTADAGPDAQRDLVSHFIVRESLAPASELPLN